MITPLYLESKGNGPRLRIGVLIDGPSVPRYVAAILKDIARTSFAAVELAVVLQQGPAAEERSRGFLHALYLRADRAAGGKNEPLALVEPGAGLAGVERLEVVAGTVGQPWLVPQVVRDIERRQLDVILRFCSTRPRGEVLRAARHGVWSYHFGADQDAREGEPFFQQAAVRTPTRDVQLEVLEEEPGAGLVLCWSRFGSQGGLFGAQARRVAIWETTHFVVWKLHDLHEGGWQRLREQAVPHDDRTSPSPGVARPPGALEMVRFVAPRVASSMVKRLRPERKDHGLHLRWKVALRRGAAPFGSARDCTSLAGFRWVEPPAGHFWADPFLLERGGGTLLFFEDYEYARGYATIRGAEVQGDCTLGPSFPCLDLGHHLSYPHVFEHDGEAFMIPESLSDGTVTLYRARRFPEEWVAEKVLYRGQTADTTAWRQGGRFYFFTTLHDRDDRGMKTFLFVADSLTGEWRLHPSNPISSDVRHARGGGAVFRQEGRLFRPSQDCGPSYGYGLNLEEVVALSDDRYEERPWCSVGPGALPFRAIGVHTFNRCGDLETIDGCVPL